VTTSTLAIQAVREPRSFSDLVEAIVRLAGCPVGAERKLWTTDGVAGFLESWEDAEAGSPMELELFLRPLDPRVRVQFINSLTGRGTTFRPSRDDGGILMAVPPGPRQGTARITWSRPELAASGRVLADAVRRIVSWWVPLGFDRVRWSMNWNRGPLAVARREPPKRWEAGMSADVDLMVRYAETFLGVRRREPVPARALVSIQARVPVSKHAGEVILAHRSLGEFLVNPEPFQPAWRLVEKRVSRDRLTATLIPIDPDRAVDRLEVLAPPECQGWRWSIDGVAMAPDPIHSSPELFGFNLTSSATRRGPVRLQAERPLGGGPDRPRELFLYPNPVLFVAAQRTQEHTYQHWFGPVDARPFQYVVLAAGGYGLLGFAVDPAEADKSAQPLAVDPAQAEESDTELLARASELVVGRLARRTDVERLVAARFPAVRFITCQLASWLEPGPPVRFIQGVDITAKTGRLESDSNADHGERIRASLQRYLEARLRAGLAPRLRMELDNE
jgi:hypothetical protein